MTVEIVVKPGSRRSGFTIEGGALTLRVHSRAIEGTANAECIRAVAERFGVAPSRVELLHGVRIRRKVFRIAGTRTPPC